MPRIRTVKPEFFRHEGLFDAERETGLPLRIAFISLWTVADREGRFKWRPRSLKAECLPLDDLDFSRVLDALSTRGFIVNYEVDGELFGLIPSFHKHQAINHRETPSYIPAPNDFNALTRDTRVDDASPTLPGHASGEGKGKERKGRSSAETRVADASLTRAPPVNPPSPSSSSSSSSKPNGANGHLPEADPDRVQLCQDVVADFNDLAEAYSFPLVKDITDSRQKLILERAKDLVETYEYAEPRAGFAKLFEQVRRSKFLQGATEHRWQENFNTLFRIDHLTSVMEGTYEDRPQKY